MLSISQKIYFNIAVLNEYLTKEASFIRFYGKFRFTENKIKEQITAVSLKQISDRKNSYGPLSMIVTLISYKLKKISSRESLIIIVLNDYRNIDDKSVIAFPTKSIYMA